jgi:hypothetical protein
MWLATALMAAALAGPNGLQALHNPQTEHTQQQLMVDRLSSTDAAAAAPRKSAGPPTPDEKRAAAWRADHLTCANSKGRTRAQFEAECRAAAADAPNP